MPVLGTILAVLSIVFAVLTLGLNITRRTKSPSGALTFTHVHQTKTIALKSVLGLLALTCGYLSGYVLGWWA